MVTVTWAAAAEVIITDGAVDVVITMAGHAADITTAIETRTGGRLLAASFGPGRRYGDPTIFDWIPGI